MEMTITFPKGTRVNAQFDNHTVQTDQPLESGGTATAPDPFSLFLASIGTCTGIYVLRFCQERKLPTQDLSLSLHAQWDETINLVDTIDITIKTGESFPEKYKNALINVAKLCTVKRQLEQPPNIIVTVTT
jgi:ribosomal protein S12 methylthiotransferase accessory factor